MIPLRLPHLVVLSIIAGLVGTAGRADAHSRSRSYSSWYIHGDRVHVRFTVSAYEVSRLPPADRRLPERLAQHLGPRLHAQLGAVECAAGPVRVGDGGWGDSGQIVAELRFTCLGAGAGHVPSIRVDAFFDQVPGHLHLARVHPERAAAVELLLTSDRRSAVGAQTAAAGFDGYLGLGITHILGGFDHLAFLLALLLLCRRPRDLVLLVTGFTLGHSLTLALVVLGVVAPEAAGIEALIGFTVALVALESAVRADPAARRRIALVAATALVAMAAVVALVPSGLSTSTVLGLALLTPCYLLLWRQDEQPPGWWRGPLVTVAFGLVHGFGFGTALAEAGLPDDAIAPALVGFNLGVELGQLGVVAILGVLAALAARFAGRRLNQLGAELLGAGLCGLGLFWFVSRAL